MDSDVAQLREQLRNATEECSARGLTFAAKWAAEQLCSLSTGATEKLPISLTLPIAKEPNHESQQKWAEQDANEQDQMLLAKCLFDMREFERVAYHLQECIGPRALFLKLYSRFLSNEKEAGFGDKEEHSQEMVISAEESEQRQAVARRKRELVAIRDELEQLDKTTGLDAFLLYLLGLVLKALGQRPQARTALLRSVHEYPCNWSAWQLLETCVDAVRQPVESLSAETRGAGWMHHAFMAQMLVEQFGGSNQDFSTHVRQLQQLFPQSPFVQGLLAVRHYSMREFEDASRLFAQLQKTDPHRLDLMDIYSNILYVMEDRARLGELAHRCAHLDRFRPETCCVIGNYYSLRREHEKAVGYFQRALQLDSKYLAAWTLMGHEFIEMKNTAAAVDAYRHAVDVDDRDYRAWYGLGQTYEMLNMPHYACSYYMRAAALRPYDSRMWCALGSCYESSGQQRQAIESYRRALLGSAENEAMAITRLAHLYDDSGERAKAAYYYQLLVEHAIKNPLSDLPAASGVGSSALHVSHHGNGQMDELAAACLFLAAFENDRGNIAVAQRYLIQIVDGASSAGASQQRVEEAKAMMRAMNQKDISA
ncbi:anaphase-promoting complex component apc8 [Coemansia brasiliensis]|uniref:Anaphase-promoting complex component apc8 n=1 Tax=Coemansia brasiliensis TaxID=2650707 RepID=A0A9W8M1V2_9FUNG|nr:anaphase-promoting complex component apc8 [Coemansia brasiliensis]